MIWTRRNSVFPPFKSQDWNGFLYGSLFASGLTSSGSLGETDTGTSELVALLKLRIVALLLFVSLAAAFAAAKGSWSMMSLASLLLAGSMSAGGAGALNHYLERDLDSLMERTRNRPLASGRVGKPWMALALGLLLVGLSFAIVLPQNVWQAIFLLSGAFIYVVVYTLWLKRRSAWNIILGGAAGSCAILAGWAAVGDWWTPQPLLLALLLFFWTPPHFWSLAIFRLDDYRKVGVPMLPVVAGSAVAARWGVVHVLLVVMTSLAIAVVGGLGAIYVSVALLAGIPFVVTALGLAMQPKPHQARSHFRASIFYLTALFAGLILDVYIRR